MTAGVTVSVSVAGVAVTPVPVALMLIGIGVVDVYDAATATLTVLDVTPAPSDAVPKVTVTPVGAPSLESATSPVKLPPRVMLALLAPDVPPVTVIAAGLTATANVPGAGGVTGLGLSLDEHPASNGAAAAVIRRSVRTRFGMNVCIDRSSHEGERSAHGPHAGVP